MSFVVPEIIAGAGSPEVLAYSGTAKLLRSAYGGSGYSYAPVASDHFNRANAAVGGVGNWTNFASGGMSIVSNEVRPTVVGGPTPYGCYRTSETYNSNQYSQITVGSLPLFSGDFVGVAVRCQDASNFYVMRYYYDGSHFILDCVKVTAGTWAQIQTLNLSGAFASGLVAGTVLTFIAESSRLSGLINGQQQWVFGDTTFTGGSPGISGYETSGNHPTLDNWQAGNVVLGPTLASDNFNRANGGASAGQANWSAPAVSFSGVSSQDATIVSNQLNLSGTSSHFTDVRANETYSPNQWASIQIGSVPVLAGSSGFVGAVVRWNGTNGYMGCVFGAPNQYQIYKLTVGSPSTQLVASSTLGSTPPAGTVITLVVRNSLLRLLANGVEQIAIADSSLTSGVPGLQCFNPSTADNWSAGNA